MIQSIFVQLFLGIALLGDWGILRTSKQ